MRGFRMCLTLWSCAVLAGACLAAVPGADAVWTPPDGAIDALHQAVENGTDELPALQNAMKAGGARPAALAFAKRIGDEGGYLGELKKAGAVSYGTLYFPLRANTHAEPVIVDANDRMIRLMVDEKVNPGDLAKLPGFLKIKTTGHLEAYPPQDMGVEQAGAKGVEIVYVFPLKTCTNCPVQGVARVAYAFDAAGKYTGRRVLEVGPPPPEPEESASPASPAPSGAASAAAPVAPSAAPATR